MFQKEFDYLKEMFTSGKSTKEVQDYLMSKYNVPRSKTSNYIKKVRNTMGIYNSK